MAIPIKFKVTLTIEDEDYSEIDMIEHKSKLESLVSKYLYDNLNDLFSNHPVSITSCKLVDCKAMRLAKKKGGKGKK